MVRLVIDLDQFGGSLVALDANPLMPFALEVHWCNLSMPALWVSDRPKGAKGRQFATFCAVTIAASYLGRKTDSACLYG